jgi:hypothetical protein
MFSISYMKFSMTAYASATKQRNLFDVKDQLDELVRKHSDLPRTAGGTLRLRSGQAPALQGRREAR